MVLLFVHDIAIKGAHLLHSPRGSSGWLSIRPYLARLFFPPKTFFRTWLIPTTPDSRSRRCSGLTTRETFPPARALKNLFHKPLEIVENGKEHPERSFVGWVVTRRCSQHAHTFPSAAQIYSPLHSPTRDSSPPSPAYEPPAS